MGRADPRLDLGAVWLTNLKGGKCDAKPSERRGEKAQRVSLITSVIVNFYIEVRNNPVDAEETEDETEIS